jgi:hypothetical protein
LDTKAGVPGDLIDDVPKAFLKPDAGALAVQPQAPRHRLIVFGILPRENPAHDPFPLTTYLWISVVPKWIFSKLADLTPTLV